MSTTSIGSLWWRCSTRRSSGVGRYDRLGSAGTSDAADAEVAFVVADAHQGRGIGSILLEHLAAAARERGIKRFVAEVLAENSRMVRVFTDAGYSAKYEYDSGVVHLTFPIAPTEQSRAVAFERERRAEARSIERMLTPGRSR
jgi:GNAT superfamily N-acetyltransferase